MSSLIPLKRKSMDDSQACPLLSPHVSNSDPPSRTQSPVGRRVTEDGSIHSIICNNPRRRLYVKPIAWTSEHLQFLGCSFNLQRAPRTKGPIKTPDQVGSRSQRSQHAKRIKLQLGLPSTLTVKKFAAQEILEAYDLRPQGQERLWFQFNHQHVANLPTDGIFASKDTPSILAFVTFETIQSLRQRHVRPSKSATVCLLNMKRKKLKLLEPLNPAEDPYLVAMLIALAQDQRRQQQQKVQDTSTTTDVTSLKKSQQHCECMDQMVPCFAKSFKKVKILAITGVLAKYLYVYTATIPTAFLDKFDEPLRYSPSDPITVTYCRISVIEETSLERLHSLLCTGSCSFCGGD
ncbi:hypothetical protein BDV25DRAFT_134993 [Aspergillus avenaceus]|uniref:Uncharacterized protein n=1 Tax=Aspergillus avenaceus TaxID=36643 RepID=A0A5N6U9I0_ASPAV|nr:hypothetical protein BDV25DRAFT_134993 [Aspergillus avenaceus]